MTRTRSQSPPVPARMPPRWFVRTFWTGHRLWYRLSRGRRGLWLPGPHRWGAMRLTVVGRRTGRQRSVILGYLEDGPRVVTLAMNGWDPAEPAWWLNLQAHPEAHVELADRAYDVRAHVATGEERERLWDRWRAVDEGLDQFALRRPRETAVVVLEPAPGRGTSVA